jgi:2-oxoglutarate ferredoxin oxidoreductase subunit beta
MPELGIEPDKTVFVSGIGCSGRFTYYMDTYGVHGIHGRAPAIATGIATANPDLNVWVVTGDGDGLSIGGNHLIHALRRNVNIKILLFNNQIYGLTKGQYSPTSEEGKVTKSTPFGSVDHPFNPIALALGAEATFVARTLDNDRQHLSSVLRAAAAHRGTAFVEIYQNCNVFNDGAFDLLRDKAQGLHNQIRLVHGEPIVFDGGTQCVRLAANGRLEIAAVADTDPEQIITHDVHGPPSLAFTLAHLSQGPTEPTCIGVFREVQRTTYGEAVHEQIARARERSGDGDLEALLTGGDTWTV